MNTTRFASSSLAGLPTAPRRSRAHWPASARAGRPSSPGVNTAFSSNQELFLAHQQAEALHLALFVFSTLAATVALVLG